MKRQDATQQPVNNVLVCGNTKLLEESTIRQIARYYHVLITGEGVVPSVKSPRVSFYQEKPSTERFSQLCYSFSPDVVWYLSGFADGQDGFADETKMIEDLVKSCEMSDVSEIIMISSVNALNFSYAGESSFFGKEKYDSERDFRCAQSERLMQFLTEKYGIRLILVRAPFLAKASNDETFLGSLFQKAKQGEKAVISYSADQRVDFISMSNLTDLMVAITEEVMDKPGSYVANSGFHYTYQDLERAIQKKVPSFEMEYQKKPIYFDADKIESAGQGLRKAYGFVATENIVESIPELYLRADVEIEKNSSFVQKAKRMLKSVNQTLLQYFELALFFALIQFLLKFTSDSIYFKFVDLRLFYVVIMAAVHGMKMGIWAGALACVSLVLQYSSIGVTSTMLFYNLDNWLPFVIYLITGSILGYMKNTKEEKIRFSQAENQVIQDKYVFLNSVYRQVITNKGEYKRQILGYQDSFGKIFDAVEKLNGSVTSDIFMNGVDTLERIMDNRSIAIYTLDEDQSYARLVACSKQMRPRLLKSMKVEDCQEVYDTIKGDEIWKNTEFLEDAPMYAYGINQQGKVLILIALYEADENQLGLYYTNLFGILCNLIRVSFIRAFEFQNAIEDEKYLAGTVILKPEYFNELLEIQKKMEEAGMASYVLLRLSSTDGSYVNEAFSGLIRHSDVLGMLEDGNYYLMLTQVTKQNFDVIGNRLAAKGFDYEIVKG